MHTAGIDNMVPEFAREGIFLFVFLFGVVFFRAQSTYWLARGVASGAMRASGRTGSPWGWAGLALIIGLIATKVMWGRRKRAAVDRSLAEDRN